MRFRPDDVVEVISGAAIARDVAQLAAEPIEQVANSASRLSGEVGLVTPAGQVRRMLRTSFS
jgi:hypothetical protein